MERKRNEAKRVRGAEHAESCESERKRTRVRRSVRSGAFQGVKRERKREREPIICLGRKKTAKSAFADDKRLVFLPNAHNLLSIM